MLLGCLFLACPARFERATYALEALKMRLNNSRNNGIKVLTIGVASAPRTMVLGGIRWILIGICRRLDDRTWILSGKPTFLSVLLNDSWVAAYDPKETFNKKPPEGGVSCLLREIKAHNSYGR
jgi:hypothetical protein